MVKFFSSGSGGGGDPGTRPARTRGEQLASASTMALETANELQAVYARLLASKPDISPREAEDICEGAKRGLRTRHDNINSFIDQSEDAAARSTGEINATMLEHHENRTPVSPDETTTMCVVIACMLIEMLGGAGFFYAGGASLIETIIIPFLSGVTTTGVSLFGGFNGLRAAAHKHLVPDEELNRSDKARQRSGQATFWACLAALVILILATARARVAADPELFLDFSADTGITVLETVGSVQSLCLIVLGVLSSAVTILTAASGFSDPVVGVSKLKKSFDEKVAAVKAHVRAAVAEMEAAANQFLSEFDTLRSLQKEAIETHNAKVREAAEDEARHNAKIDQYALHFIEEHEKALRRWEIIDRREGEAPSAPDLSRLENLKLYELQHNADRYLVDPAIVPPESMKLGVIEYFNQLQGQIQSRLINFDADVGRMLAPDLAQLSNFRTVNG